MAQPKYLVSPDVVTRRVPGGVEVGNRVHGTRLVLSPAVLDVLAFFATPATLAALGRRYRAPRRAIDALVSHYILVEPAELAVLADRLVRPSPVAIWERVKLEALAERARPGGFAIFGAPCELGAPPGAGPGPRDGPAEIRRVFKLGNGRPVAELRRARAIDVDLRRSYSLAGLQLLDLGDINCEVGDGLAAFGARITHVVGRIARAGMTPIMLGGDHSLTWFPLQRLLQEHDAVGVLHFDAHHDLYDDSARLTHANPFVFACKQPGLRYLRQIGLRTLEVRTAAGRPIRDRRISCVTSRELQALSPAQVFKGLPRGLPCYLSFDVDCMSPALVRETGACVPGGLDYYQGLALIDYAARHFRIVGADFVEVAAGLGGHNVAALVVARYLAQLVLGPAEFEPMATYFFHHPPRSAAADTIFACDTFAEESVI